MYIETNEYNQGETFIVKSLASSTKSISREREETGERQKQRNRGKWRKKDMMNRESLKKQSKREIMKERHRK